MKVILDTNILVADPWLAGADFHVFLSSMSETGHELIVPKLVLDEAVNKYGEKLSAAHRQLDEAAGELGKLLGQRAAAPKEQDREAQVAKYRSALEEKLNAVAASIVPYPRVSHEVLVRRALERKRPFREKGTGYRDALIWLSVVPICRSGVAVALVSNDSGDFFHHEGGPHPDLLHDVRGGTTPTFYRSLREFVEREVKPRLSAAASIKSELNKHGLYKGFDVRKAVRERVLDDMRYLSPDLLGMPAEAEHAAVLDVTEVVAVDVSGVHRVSDQEYVIDLSTDCEIRFETYAWDDVPEEDIDLPDPTEDEAFDEMYPPALLRVSASFTVNLETGKVTAVTVHDVRPVV